LVVAITAVSFACWAATTASTASATSNVATVGTPSITGLHESALKWREKNVPPSTPAHEQPPVGTTFTFTLNEPALVKFTFTARLAGRTVEHRCVPKTTHNAGRPHCAFKSSVSSQYHKGPDRWVFGGGLVKVGFLSPGNYTLTLTATVGALTSIPRHITFTVVK
jgi:hypothetical protein